MHMHTHTPTHTQGQGPLKRTPTGDFLCSLRHPTCHLEVDAKIIFFGRLQGHDSHKLHGLIVSEDDCPCHMFLAGSFQLSVIHVSLVVNICILYILILVVVTYSASTEESWHKVITKEIGIFLSPPPHARALPFSSIAVIT